MKKLKPQTKRAVCRILVYHGDHFLLTYFFLYSVKPTFLFVFLYLFLSFFLIDMCLAFCCSFCLLYIFLPTNFFYRLYAGGKGGH